VQRLAASARELVTRAEALRDTDPRAALRLALAADRLDPHAGGRASLLATLTATPIKATLAGHTDLVGAVALAADGRTALTHSDDDTAILWDLTNPTRPARQATLPGNVGAVALAADGRTALTSSDDGTMIVWNLTNPARPARRATLTGHTNWVSAVALAADGRTALTGSNDLTAILWDLANPTRPTRQATLTGHTSGVDAVALAADGRTALTGAIGLAILWDRSRVIEFAAHVVDHACAAAARGLSEDEWAQAVPGISYKVNIQPALLGVEGMTVGRRVAPAGLCGRVWGQSGAGSGGIQGRPRMASRRAAIMLWPCLAAVDR
jgi:WD40 repeat protein